MPDIRLIVSLVTSIIFWDKPFSLAAKGIRAGMENLLVVRVHDSEAMGGIFRHVRLLVGRQPHQLTDKGVSSCEPPPSR